jgi:hypothetical protein
MRDVWIVYAVHAVRPEEICATALLTSSLAAAEQYAATLSCDPGVLAGAVTRFTVDSPRQGLRTIRSVATDSATAATAGAT